MNRRVLSVAEAALWALVAVLFLVRIVPQARAAIGWHSASVREPDLRLTSLTGTPLNLTDLKGQVVLVNFWATWCPPCRAEMPGFQRLYADKHAAGFTVVGISMDQSDAAHVAAFLAERGIAYPVAMGSEDAAVAFGNIDSFPTSFLIDRAGRIRYTVHGIFAEPLLRSAVNRLLAEQS